MSPSHKEQLAGKPASQFRGKEYHDIRVICLDTWRFSAMIRFLDTFSVPACFPRYPDRPLSRNDVGVALERWSVLIKSGTDRARSLLTLISLKVCIKGAASEGSEQRLLVAYSGIPLRAKALHSRVSFQGTRSTSSGNRSYPRRYHRASCCS